jgi:hypothetical protein
MPRWNAWPCPATRRDADLGHGNDRAHAVCARLRGRHSVHRGAAAQRLAGQLATRPTGRPSACGLALVRLGAAAPPAHCSGCACAGLGRHAQHGHSSTGMARAGMGAVFRTHSRSGFGAGNGTLARACGTAARPARCRCYRQRGPTTVAGRRFARRRPGTPCSAVRASTDPGCGHALGRRASGGARSNRYTRAEALIRIHQGAVTP